MAGDEGEKGIMGEMGDKGGQGDMGDQGDKGMRGPPGRIGHTGKKGDRGCSKVSACLHSVCLCISSLYYSPCLPSQSNLMESQAQMTNDSGDSRPQVGSVGFVLDARSLCVYTPLGWVDVEVCMYMYVHVCVRREEVEE